MTVRRPDLEALGPDDLAAMTNRGLVKRAAKELDGGLTAEWQCAEDGTVEARWSDGVTTRLPGNKTVREAVCSCAALELCRHVIRTVFAWQARARGADDREGQAGDTSSGGEVARSEWDPGSMSEEALAAHVGPAPVRKADQIGRDGVVVELIRGEKPSARFYHPGHTVRFPVPGDLRYAQCSCAEPAPCGHAVLAVRAFRKLPAEKRLGFLSEGGTWDRPVEPEILAEAERCVAELLEHGMAGLAPAWRDGTHRAARACVEAGLIWPGEILEELAADYEAYTAQDSAFTPDGAVDRAGELLVRLDAIRSGRAPVPQAFLRGLPTDRDTELGAARFIGLGACAVERRGGTVLNTFLQDANTGHLLVHVRAFVEGTSQQRMPFQGLARAVVVKDTSLAALASGQLLAQGAKRTAAGRLVLGRARAALNPQSFQWESLKAPVLVDDFAELTARLAHLPPALFRPRRASGDFHVCPVTRAEHARFDPIRHSIVAEMHDRAAGTATLVHPWRERAAPGSEALLQALQRERISFVAGQMQMSRAGLIVLPTAVVFEGANGRWAIFPWIDGPPRERRGDESLDAARGELPLGAERQRLPYAAGATLMEEVVLNGLRRLADRGWRDAERAARASEADGYHRLGQTIRRMAAGAGDVRAAMVLVRMLALGAAV